MANRNGSYFRGHNQNRPHFGMGLGLPAGFPINTTTTAGQPYTSFNSSSNSNYHPNQIRHLTNFQRPQIINAGSGSQMQTYQLPPDPSNLTINVSNPPNSYTLTDFDLAIAANSTLTVTAGEFIPRSQSEQSVRRPLAQEVPVAEAEANSTVVPHNLPTNNRQDARFYQHNQRTQGLPIPRGRFSNQKRNSGFSTGMDDSKTQDRRRLLAEAAAFLTSSNQEPPNVGSVTASSSREPQRNNVDIVPKGRTEDNFQTSKEVFTNKPVSASSVNSARYAGKYENNSRRTGGNWRGNGNGGSTTSEETFTNSRNYQGRHGNNPATSRPSPHRKPSPANASKDVTADQREKLTHQLSSGALECLVCCEHVRQHEPVWSCMQCHHVLHLKCVRKWAFTSKSKDNGWRCPACQNVTSIIPSEYFCFCGKVRDPEWNRQEVAHTCGEVCSRSLSARKADCVHRCTLLCHPGPCPPCAAQTKRNCGCGKASRLMKCGGDAVLLCEAICNKALNCGLHSCEKTCHIGECGDCEKKVDQVCHCGKENRQMDCTVDTHSTLVYCCGNTCERQLTCGNHTCDQTCHEGPCIECQLTPQVIKRCPCNKTALTAERTSCLDEIPTCGQACGKKLKCGQPNSPHVCQVNCHSGPCPPCPLDTLVRCRCGNMDQEIPCVELTSKADDARCTKKCTKKRACGKHRCNQMCCIDFDHVCPLVCNHQLSCGRHRCEELCHRGHCKPCPRISWEEHYCECRQTVQLPPIPCGTRPPDCTELCPRDHSCEHQPQHNCHSFSACPPCSVLTSKWCYGKHEFRGNVPCYLKEISCGLPCGMLLDCQRHNCIQPCHPGQCMKPGQKCCQGCVVPRSLCGHNCAAPCHVGPCPDVPCKEMVKVTCECGHRSVSRACADNAKEYQRIATSLLASKMADMQLGLNVDIADLAGNASSRKVCLKTLECTEECKVIERNRRLAIGLQIRNPDLSAKLTPRYSEFMRGWAKKDAHFCQQIHSKLTELVQLAKQSKQKSRSYSFEPMNRDKRHFVHEYCEHFGCESEAYDPEPKRNVVATAVKEKAWLPSMSLMEVIQRENGVRKIPKPLTNYTNLNATTSVASTSGTAWRRVPPTANTAVNQPRPLEPTPPDPAPSETEPIIDYFDFTAS